MKALRSLLIVLLLSISSAKAMMIDYIKIECTPEEKSFNFEYFGSEEEDWITNEKIRVTSTKHHDGIFDPSNLHYTCVIGTDRFKLIASQEPMRERGYCGGAPEVIVTLLKNGKPIFSGLVLGDSCWGNPTISNVEVKAGATGSISICSQAENGKTLCKESKL